MLGDYETEINYWDAKYDNYIKLLELLPEDYKSTAEDGTICVNMLKISQLNIEQKKRIIKKSYRNI